MFFIIYLVSLIEMSRIFKTFIRKISHTIKAKIPDPIGIKCLWKKRCEVLFDAVGVAPVVILFFDDFIFSKILSCDVF